MHPKLLQRRIDSARKKQAEIIAQYGYVVHMVPGKTTHTHGLLRNYGHPDLECTLPMNPEILKSLINDMGSRIKAGARFTDGDLIHDLIENYTVKLVASSHGLRIILPDPDGQLEEADMHPAYAAQYKNLQTGGDGE